MLSTPEQIAIRRRLRAQVLLGCADARTEVCRGVPGPARIVEDRPCQGDEVGVASSDDRLRLLERGNQTYGNHRQTGGGFDRACQRHLITRTNWYLLRWRQSSARDMNRAAPACLEFFGKDDGLIEVPSAGRPIRA